MFRESKKYERLQKKFPEILFDLLQTRPVSEIGIEWFYKRPEELEKNENGLVFVNVVDTKALAKFWYPPTFNRNLTYYGFKLRDVEIPIARMTEEQRTHEPIPSRRHVMMDGIKKPMWYMPAFRPAFVTWIPDLHRLDSENYQSPDVLQRKIEAGSHSGEFRLALRRDSDGMRWCYGRVAKPRTARPKAPRPNKVKSGVANLTGYLNARERGQRRRNMTESEEEEENEEIIRRARRRIRELQASEELAARSVRPSRTVRSPATKDSTPQRRKGIATKESSTTTTGRVGSSRPGSGAAKVGFVPKEDAAEIIKRKTRASAKTKKTPEKPRATKKATKKATKRPTKKPTAARLAEMERMQEYYAAAEAAEAELARKKEQEEEDAFLKELDDDLW